MFSMRSNLLNIEFPKQLKIRENAGDLEETKDYRFLSNFGKRLKTSWVIFAVTGLAFLFGFFGLTLFFTFISSQH